MTPRRFCRTSSSRMAMPRSRCATAPTCWNRARSRSKAGTGVDRQSAHPESVSRRLTDSGDLLHCCAISYTASTANTMIGLRNTTFRQRSNGTSQNSLDSAVNSWQPFDNALRQFAALQSHALRPTARFGVQLYRDFPTSFSISRNLRALSSLPCSTSPEILGLGHVASVPSSK